MNLDKANIVNTWRNSMKKFVKPLATIAVATTVALTITACGDTTKQTVTRQETVTNKEVEPLWITSEDWWKDRVYQNSETGLYFWVGFSGSKDQMLFWLGDTPMDTASATCVGSTSLDYWKLQKQTKEVFWDGTNSEYLKAIVSYRPGQDDMYLLFQGSDGQMTTWSGLYTEMASKVVGSSDNWWEGKYFKSLLSRSEDDFWLERSEWNWTCYTGKYPQPDYTLAITNLDTYTEGDGCFCYSMRGAKDESLQTLEYYPNTDVLIWLDEEGKVVDIYGGK